MSARPTIYILDAYSLIYQNFHGVPLMTGPAGQPTNAVFGMFRDLLGMLKTRKPEYLAAAFDGALSVESRPGEGAMFSFEADFDLAPTGADDGDGDAPDREVGASEVEGEAVAGEQ